MRCWSKRRPRALVRPAGELDVRTFGFDRVLFQLRFGAFERCTRGQKVGLGAAQLGEQQILVELGEHVAFATTLSTSTRSALMMPFAFDLISTLVIGSTLPVATTERTMVPRSTVASFDGSMSTDAPRRVTNPAAAAPTTATPPRSR